MRELTTQKLKRTKNTTTPMNDILSNRIAMFGACITVAKDPQHRPVWDNVSPLDFGTDLTGFETAYKVATGIASQAGELDGGNADAKDAAETDLEDKAFGVARALAIHFKKEGDLVNRAKVDVTRSAIKRLRDELLLNKTTEIRDVATVAASHANAAARGITAAKITELTAAITTFAQLRNSPRGRLATRASLLRELETRVADLMDAIRDLDDLVVQYEGTYPGRVFSAAWRQARQIVSLGHRFEPEVPTATPTPTPAPVAPPTAPVAG
jgi:hypothetical protein